jgi:hypothetical protein
MTIALQSITSIMLAIVISIGGDVAITQIANSEILPEQLACAICNKQITPSEAVAGLHDLYGGQQFACNGHFWNSHQFIAGWADFIAAQRKKRTHSQFAYEYGEDMDARTLH